LMFLGILIVSVYHKIAKNTWFILILFVVSAFWVSAKEAVVYLSFVMISIEFNC